MAGEHIGRLSERHSSVLETVCGTKGDNAVDMRSPCIHMKVAWEPVPLKCFHCFPLSAPDLGPSQLLRQKQHCLHFQLSHATNTKMAARKHHASEVTGTKTEDEKTVSGGDSNSRRKARRTHTAYR